MSWGAALLLAVVVGPAQASCIPIARFQSPALFARYPAPAITGPWRAPDVRRGEAHAFRTTLRRYGQGEPGFAGRYTVVENGCGAGAICPAFVDRSTGRVSFVPALRVVTWLSGDLGDDHERLTYRRDSRLLVVVGARNERAATAGVSLYDWRGGGPRLIRFVAQRKLCRRSAAG